MHKSLRTRLLLNAYQVASDLAYRLYRFSSYLQARASSSETRDYENYLGKLTEERITQSNAIATAEYRLGEIQGEHDRVSGILGYTPRPQVPMFNEVPPITPSDLTELDLLPPVDEDEAPIGYKAVPAQTWGCTGCSFDPVNSCPHNTEGGVSCIEESRADTREVIFVKR